MQVSHSPFLLPTPLTHSLPSLVVLRLFVGGVRTCRRFDRSCPSHHLRTLGRHHRALSSGTPLPHHSIPLPPPRYPTTLSLWIPRVPFLSPPNHLLTLSPSLPLILCPLSSFQIAELGIYPAVDPLDSTSRMLDPRVIGETHYATARATQKLLQVMLYPIPYVACPLPYD